MLEKMKNFIGENELGLSGLKSRGQITTLRDQDENSNSDVK